jgi:hypothetical protein
MELSRGGIIGSANSLSAAGQDKRDTALNDVLKRLIAINNHAGVLLSRQSSFLDRVVHPEPRETASPPAAPRPQSQPVMAEIGDALDELDHIFREFNYRTDRMERIA